MTDTLKMYRVTLTSDILTGPFIVELVSTSERGAVARARYAAMHTYRCVALLTASARADVLHEYTCAATGHDADAPNAVMMRKPHTLAGRCNAHRDVTGTSGRHIELRGYAFRQRRGYRPTGVLSTWAGNTMAPLEGVTA